MSAPAKTPTETHADDDLRLVNLRLEPGVHAALAARAQAAHREFADYCGDVLTTHVLDDIAKADRALHERLEAELEIKAEAVRIALERKAEHGFEETVTLLVFQAIKASPALTARYTCAIGGRPPSGERGNHLKARLNRSLGASIKVAVGGRPQLRHGRPVMVQVRDEFIFSFTLLEPDDED